MHSPEPSINRLTNRNMSRRPIGFSSKEQWPSSQHLSSNDGSQAMPRTM